MGVFLSLKNLDLSVNINRRRVRGNGGKIPLTSPEAVKNSGGGKMRGLDKRGFRYRYSIFSQLPPPTRGEGEYIEIENRIPPPLTGEGKGGGD